VLVVSVRTAQLQLLERAIGPDRIAINPEQPDDVKFVFHVRGDRQPLAAAVVCIWHEFVAPPLIVRNNRSDGSPTLRCYATTSALDQVFRGEGHW
jgi:hypothetical protein